MAEAERCGVKIVTGAQVSDIKEDPRGVRVTTANGRIYECAHLVNTAGLYADKIAHLCNVARDYTVGHLIFIFPFVYTFVYCPVQQLAIFIEIFYYRNRFNSLCRVKFFHL